MTFRVTPELQVWLPAIHSSLGTEAAARDAERVFREWSPPDRRVWVLPWLKEVVRWSDPDPAVGQCLAVPGERLERIDVLHVGRNGWTWQAPGGEIRLVGSTTHGLLGRWLDAIPKDGLRWLEPIGSFTIDVPRFTKAEVSYHPVELHPAPGAAMPATRAPSGALRLHWPPPDGTPGPAVSIDAEGRQWAQRQPAQAEPLLVLPVWPAPLERICPKFSGIDEVMANAHMRKVMERSHTDRVGALGEAITASGLYVRACQITRELSWFWPSVAEVGVHATIARAATLKITDAPERSGAEASFDEDAAWEWLRRSATWKQRMLEQVPATRVWGPIGLFWALLIACLQDRQQLGFCHRCGSVVGGRRQYCDRSNPDCFRARAAERQRRSRVARSARGTVQAD